MMNGRRSLLGLSLVHAIRLTTLFLGLSLVRVTLLTTAPPTAAGTRSWRARSGAALADCAAKSRVSDARGEASNGAAPAPASSVSAAPLSASRASSSQCSRASVSSRAPSAERDREQARERPRWGFEPLTARRRRHAGNAPLLLLRPSRCDGRLPTRRRHGQPIRDAAMMTAPPRLHESAVRRARRVGELPREQRLARRRPQHEQLVALE